MAITDVKEVLRRSGAVRGLVADARSLRSRLKGSPRAVIANYVLTQRVRKLHIGAGPTQLDGWLATDIEPRRADVVYLDATRRFPIARGKFDYVFSEHMIEHLSWEDGQVMLRECVRILKPGGRVRIATPDLAVILGLYKKRPSKAAKHYVQWITKKFLADRRACHPAFVINNAFRNWGHQFLYDEELMTLALERAGFVAIRRCAVGKSDNPHLQGIEHHGRNIEDQKINRFETMVFEAAKPA